MSNMIWVTGDTQFTFHNVSINTDLKSNYIAGDIHLHSTMFLLILAVRMDTAGLLPFTFHNVSINT